MSQSLSHRKTKIVATIGPASTPVEVLTDLISHGLNVARLNFSHGNFETHSQVYKNLRKISSDLQAPVGILQDLQGPKIRLDQFVEQRELKRGELIWISDQG